MSLSKPNSIFKILTECVGALTLFYCLASCLKTSQLSVAGSIPMKEQPKLANLVREVRECGS